MATATFLPAFSYPVVGYAYDITGCTENGTSANSITCGGIAPDFNVNGILVVDCSTKSAGAATPLAAYASVDTDSIVNNANSAQTVVFDLYVFSTGGAGVDTTVRILVY
ncbi:hypothetical protein EPO05_06120 [Patescibacteria group bacterium]|nr:MAG: hypothetical protein EPO05_06120 [Patescibacteria group bacterium]